MANWHILKLWTFEILCLIASVGMLIAMVAILASYNGKPIFDGRVITLNAIISTLSTGSKATLLTAMASCISQGAWILFAERPRRLYDFEMISDASRGPLGSLKVLWSRGIRGAVLVRIGAVATILTIAFDPFTQQLVQLDKTNRVVVDSAEFAYAMRYSKGTQQAPTFPAAIVTNGRVQMSDYKAVFADADFTMQSAITFGLTATSEAIQQEASFNCPAADCDFEPVTSLAVCSKCVDLTSQMMKSEEGNGTQFSDLKFDQSSAVASRGNTDYSLPNGLLLDNMNGRYGIGQDMVYMTMLGTSNTSQTVAMGDLDTLIWSQTVIKVDADPDSEVNTTWPDFDVHASECALYYCVRKYNATSRGALMNVSSEIQENEKRLKDSWNLTFEPKWAENISDSVVQSIAYHPFDSIIPRNDLQLGHEGSDTVWNISQVAIDGISSYVSNVFAACRNDKNCTTYFALEKWELPNGFYLRERQNEQYRPSAAKILFETKDFNQTFENIAASMSNALRAGADDNVKGKGDKLVPTTVYKVAWPWIILHIVTELGGLLLLIGTIWSTIQARGKVPVWKTSELAVFSRGFMVSDVLKGAETMGELRRRAQQAPMVLVNDQHPETEGIPLVERSVRPKGSSSEGSMQWNQQ